jgi:protein-L-isoaspartate(D-aspartate) O-methyltransferase
MLDLAEQRRQMIEYQIAQRGVRDDRVLSAMRQVPREAFIDRGMEEFAYEDSPLPIGSGQTISQPYIVALMAEAAEIDDGDTVLEVGAGSGYAAAILSRMAAKVYTIERHRTLVTRARCRWRDLGYDNIEVRVGDGTLGWPEAAPFDAILVAAGGPIVPPALKAQLAINGRLIIPIGAEENRQSLLRIVRRSADAFEEES